MRLSTKGEYGVRAMAVLAYEYKNGATSLRVIAEREHLSELYLEQLFRELKKAGLVSSIRGPKGGYMLSKPPSDITVGDVVRVLEGPLAPVDCVSEEETKDPCSKESCCLTKFVWAKLRDSMAKVLDEITFGDIIKDLSNEKLKLNDR
ncbi:Rrf2 family transcriptional regulator [Proteinivorax hydrogeniformans]|uniref:Rrf2 family transcriptional regulator n=1 Tax=Proteinivorax hydrogeniformans TaxID=1826727 RepID=A0AAU8HTU0_9FIRM